MRMNASVTVVTAFHVLQHHNRSCMLNLTHVYSRRASSAWNYSLVMKKEGLSSKVQVESLYVTLNEGSIDLSAPIALSRLTNLAYQYVRGSEANSNDGKHGSAWLVKQAAPCLLKTNPWLRDACRQVVRRSTPRSWQVDFSRRLCAEVFSTYFV